MCQYAKRLAQGDLNFELVKDDLVIPGRTYATNASGCPTKFNMHDLNTATKVDVARIISNDLKMIASSSHHLGNITPSILAFPGLIMGLCQKARVSLPFVFHETIDGEVNDRVAYSYTWDMLKSNQRDFMFMHDSMHQLQLQIRENYVDHNLGTREEFWAHANWPEGRLFQPEGAVGVEVETSGETVEEESEEGESMSD
ncbi:hypothetical protein KIW84_062862 [Lathyrus oleraceus]|uniref:Uncharacterized protein n=1 Tax=Pisum sativum TaxID=3888 RepID=A0A9D4W9X2_PEA|nr:hypothetical protein KIW84_062862 [Pisum sativum]